MLDALIIGAGPSGLAAALRLAHFGKKVLLAEAHSRLGGLNSWHQVAGVEISSGLHAFTNYWPEGGGVLARLCRQLRLKPADLDLYPQSQSSIRFPSATLVFDNHPERLRSEVARVFPGEIDQFDRFRQLLRDTDEGVVEVSPTRPLSARAVLENHIRNPLLRDMLLCPVMFYGNPGGLEDGRPFYREEPDMDWLLFCVVWKCLFETGLACPAGGMRSLWEKLANRFQAEGGELRLGLGVERLCQVDGQVTEAQFTNGERYSARCFFSSAGRVETAALLGLTTPEGETGTTSIVEGLALLDRAAAQAGLSDTALFYSRQDRFAFGPAAGEELADRQAGVVCALGNYALPEESRRHIVKISQLADYPAWRSLSPESYPAAKQRVAAGMREDLAQLGVDLAPLRERDGKFGVFDDVFTPLTLERFTRHRKGALYGSPRKSRNGATACPNLFLIGADQGFHGIVGAMLSGVAMANRHVLAGGAF
ncbi:MAG: FAD-dependent oxidoreductase [Planctomycetota bacterium]|jgi:phytoene dehydrogenase-like protein|nr:FAD-dependent oxidoreductase [Planctomycetota bacterium]